MHAPWADSLAACCLGGNVGSCLLAACRVGLLGGLPSHRMRFPDVHAPCAAQDNEKKQKREPKETAEELQECEMVFADF